MLADPFQSSMVERTSKVRFFSMSHANQLVTETKMGPRPTAHLPLRADVVFLDRK